MTSLDAKAAMFIRNLVVMSPNKDYVPDVPTGTSEVQFNASLWLQPYLVNYPFFTLIPRKLSNPGNYKLIMWWLSRGDKFQPSEDLYVGGVGLMWGVNFDKLDKEVHKLKD